MCKAVQYVQFNYILQLVIKKMIDLHKLLISLKITLKNILFFKLDQNLFGITNLLLFTFKHCFLPI